MPKKETRIAKPQDTDLNLLFETLQAELGGRGVVLQSGRDLEGRFDLRRPCGIPSLDISTGGGLPAGGLSQIDGPEGAGKNLLLYHYFAQIQAMYGDDTNIFMLCMEFPFDKMFARKIGFRVPLSNYEIDVERRRRKESGEAPLSKEELKALQDDKGCGTFHLLRGCAEANLDAIVAMIASNAYQMGAVDSWDAMLTSWEDETDLSEDARMASASSIQTRWMRKVHSALTPRKFCPSCGSLEMEHKKTSTGSYNWYCRGGCGWKGKRPGLDEIETTIVGIRQVRANLNKGKYGRDWKIGGAWALKHGKLIDIQLRQTDVLKIKDTKVGKEIGWELVKGKAGTHEGPKGTFRYYFDPPEIDVDHDFYTYCTANEIIKRAGAVYTFGDQKFKGKAEVLTALHEDPKFKDVLWQAMLDDAGLRHVRYKDIG